MQFCYLGISYKNAKQQIRDQVSFTDTKKIEYLGKMDQIGISQCIVLSTCNRSEVFFLADEEKKQELARECYENLFSGVSLQDYLQESTGTEAMEYFFRITSGLESLVLGEDQILGQVREAFSFSKALGMTDKEMNKIVREAVTLSKKIKTDLKISENPMSVSYIGIRMLADKFGISGKKALVIGSGKTAELAIRYLYDYGASEVIVCNRTISHAKNLRETFNNIKIVDYSQRYQVLGDVELVVSATAAPHTVITEERRTDEKKHGWLDLAIPRDIDPAAVSQEGEVLIDMDLLGEIAEQNRQERMRLVEISRTWVEKAVQETQNWIFESRVDETIGTLNQRCAEIVEDTYEYLERKLSLDAREQKILKKMLSASLRRLLREPILELKNTDSLEKQQEYQRILRELFQLEDKKGD